MGRNERMRTMTKGRINLSLDQSIIDELTRMAEKQGCSVSSLTNSILKGGLDTKNELVGALEHMSITELLDILTAEGRKKLRRK